MTVREAVDAAVRILLTAGFPTDDARRDAGVLARHVLGWTLTEWATHADGPMPPAMSAQLDALTERRARREPVAYVRGVREFYGREFLVTPAVLIPRPETEGIVEAVTTGDLGNRGTGERQGREGSPWLMIDIGTGSGCLAITLALAFPHARVVATDVSSEALDVARTNAQRLGAHGVEFVETSFLPSDLPPADLIVTNPPYVPERDRASLVPDVRDYEPAAALFAGEDGLDVIRALLPRAKSGLKAGGVLVMEIGAGQSAAVSALVTRAGLRLVTIRPDLQGIPRVVVATA